MISHNPAHALDAGLVVLAIAPGAGWAVSV